MKVFLRTYNLEAKEDEPQYTEVSCESMAEAKIMKSSEDKIHLCYHDEKPVRPCQLI